MLKLIGYGGLNEIGGNKFTLEDESARLMLDFGLSFSVSSKYLDEFLNPRKLNGILDYQELGLLPKIKGIYRTDYLSHNKLPEEELEFDALLLSHAHADHASYVHFLRSDLPIYATKETFSILKSIEDTSAGFANDLCTFTKSFQFGTTKDGKPKRLDSRDPGISTNRPLHAVEKKFTFGDFEVDLSPVNHSLLGSCAFIIKNPKATIVYSGDLRFHGYGGHLTEDFVKKAFDADILLMEGTRINQNDTKSEDDVKKEISNHISNCKKLVLANWPFKDTDRLWSFYSAAVENDRLLAISTKQAYLLEQLHSTGADVPRLDDKNIRIFLTRRGWGFLGSDAPKSEIERDYSYTKWELPYLDHKNTVTYKDIQGDYSRYVLRADLFDMTELIDIKPPEGSIYIRSVVEPFDDEMRVSEQKLDNWLSLFKLTKYQAHCSGHAPGSDLKRIVEEISPKTVIPIHTTNPLKFKEWGFNVCLLESSVKTSF